MIPGESAPHPPQAKMMLEPSRAIARAGWLSLRPEGDWGLEHAAWEKQSPSFWELAPGNWGKFLREPGPMRTARQNPGPYGRAQRALALSPCLFLRSRQSRAPGAAGLAQGRQRRRMGNSDPRVAGGDAGLSRAFPVVKDGKERSEQSRQPSRTPAATGPGSWGRPAFHVGTPGDRPWQVGHGERTFHVPRSSRWQRNLECGFWVLGRAETAWSTRDICKQSEGG